MADSKLPNWGYYVIAGISAALMLSLGVNGTLLVQDRKAVALTLNKFGDVLETQQKIQSSQDNILRQVCLLLTLDYPNRIERMKNYPFIWPEKVK